MGGFLQSVNTGYANHAIPVVDTTFPPATQPSLTKLWFHVWADILGAARHACLVPFGVGSVCLIPFLSSHHVALPLAGTFVNCLHGTLFDAPWYSVPTGK